MRDGWHCLLTCASSASGDACGFLFTSTIGARSIALYHLLKLGDHARRQLTIFFDPRAQSL